MVNNHSQYIWEDTNNTQILDNWYREWIIPAAKINIGEIFKRFYSSKIEEDFDGTIKLVYKNRINYDK